MPQFGGKQAPGAFYDSDFTTIDEILAVSLLYGLQGKSDCRVAIITMSRPNLAVAGFVDAVERYYHGPAANFAQLPPVGMRTEGAAGETSAAFTAPFQRKKSDGTPALKNEVKSVIETGDPVTLIRNYLQAQQDHSAYIMLAGPASNLAASLSSPGVKPLLAAKVKHLVVAIGAFPQGGAQASIQADIPAAKKLFAEWPTPIVAVGAEVGAGLPFPGSSIDKQFATTAPDNPVADAYRAFQTMPYDCPSPAMAAALYACRPGEGYFKLSGAGKISVDDQGGTSFAPSEKGTHQYLVLDPAQKEKILSAYVELASAKPEPARRFRPPQQDTPPPDKTAPPAPAKKNG